MGFSYSVRRCHKWIALVVGVQALLWMASGVYMTVVPLNRHTYLESCYFYVCGPPAMLHTTRNMLSEMGVPETRRSFDDSKI
ncbi:hypothetical protein [Massilia sp. TWR1-2-2]|uniref:hypothetical protein n=1 Tax=Massilia sp. TWR1-2-2 TaxID=2804584 RepID=UPI003CFAA364